MLLHSPLPDVTKCLQYGTALSGLSDPVGAGINQASYGSAWPMFGLVYARITGRPVCVVPCAVGGSSLLAAADSGNGNWSPTGTLLAAAMTKIAAAMTALTVAGYAPIYRAELFCQGEADGGVMGQPGVTGPLYESGLQDLISSFRAVYPDGRFIISRTGTEGALPDAGFQLVRQAQENVVASGSAVMGFRGALDFQTRPGMIQTTGPEPFVHYTQAGYNEMGYSMAMAAASVVQGSPIPIILPGESHYSLDGNQTRFLPAIVPENAGGAPPSTNAAGCSVDRLGRLVNATITGRVASLGAGNSGDVRLTVPYSFGEKFSGIVGTVELRNAASWPSGVLQLGAYSADGQGYMRIIGSVPGAAQQFVQWSNLKVGTQINARISYLTDDP